MGKPLFVPCSKCSTLNRIQPASSRPNAIPICGSCRAPLPIHGNLVESNGQGLQKILSAVDGPVVIDFWAPWCGPCRSFAPVFQEASERLDGKCELIKVNTEESPIVAGQFEIRAIPTLVIMKSGRELSRQSGALPLPALMKWIEAAGL